MQIYKKFTKKEKIKMKPREFHIWDFPENKVRVLLRNHKEFLDNGRKFFGSWKALGNYLGISPYLIVAWKRHPLYIPLRHVKKIVNKLQLDWTKIEKDIISYKGINTSTPIINPKLPIKENPEIFGLITHIICDGSVNKNGIPQYVNSKKSLIDNFNQILKNNFGNMNTKLYFGGGTYKNVYAYRFPKIIIELLEHFYKIRLYKADKLPKEIFDLPKEFSIAVIRAFADDEGNVDTNKRIGLSSTSKNLLKTLTKLLREKLYFESISDIIQKDKSYYCFYIKPANLEKYGKNIGFNHPDKNKKLREMIELKSIGYKPGDHGKDGETREKLLKLLDDNVLSTYDIMKEIKINGSNITMQIKKLRNQGLVVQHSKIRQTVFWTREK